MRDENFSLKDSNSIHLFGDTASWLRRFVIRKSILAFSCCSMNPCFMDWMMPSKKGGWGFLLVLSNLSTFSKKTILRSNDSQTKLFFYDMAQLNGFLEKGDLLLRQSKILSSFLENLQCPNRFYYQFLN